MATKSVSLKDLPGVLERDMRTLEKRVGKAIHRTAIQGARVCAANAPHAFGEIVAGLEVTLIGAGAEIRSTAPHSSAVEHGRRPGKQPPLEPIERWVKLRGMQGLSPGSSGAPKAVASMFSSLGRKPPKGDRGEASRVDAPRRIAFLIARKIGRDGIPPTFFMGRSVPAIEAVLDTHIGAALEEAL